MTWRKREIEALKLALEALEMFCEHGAILRPLEIRDALKKALAQPEQKPVAWMEMVVANLVREGVNKHKARELAQHFYTSPQRTWVGLTPDEVFGISDQHLVEGFDPNIMAYTRAIEAKLKEKNT